MLENSDNSSRQKGKNAPARRTVKTFNLRDYMQALHRHIHFQSNDNSNHTIVTIVDSKTNKVLRETVQEDSLLATRR